jgi:Flp pilus assembly protein TadG
MRLQSLRAIFRDSRGSVMVFTMLAIIFLLVVGGLAVDFAYQFVVDNELERAMDAAALAGAGKLGFDDTAFPTARQFARDFAANNAYRIGTINLALNTNNAYTGSLASMASPYGDVVLGVWDPGKPAGVGGGKRFEPSNDGTRVNAVWCRYKTTIPTTLFRLWGITNMTVGAQAFATANPPQLPPPDACIFPLGLCDTPFNGPTSAGCSTVVSFISSSGNSNVGENTAAWVAPSGEADAAGGWGDYLKNYIASLTGGACNGSSQAVGNNLDVNNGMIQAVFDALKDVFIQKYNESSSDPILLKDSAGNTVYSGQGWKIAVPVIGCSGGAISGTKEIVGWTTFAMTQVINKGDCAVANHKPDPPLEPNPWDPKCNANGTAGGAAAKSFRGLYGYYVCEISPQPPVPTPTPRTALATKLRIVQ